MVYKFTLFLLTTVVFWWYSSSVLDPDFGWHLRVGNLIQKDGIPKTDPFSYTMQSYPFIDHEWLTDVLISFLYPPLGYAGLALIFALLATASLFLGTYRLNKHLFTIPYLLIATTLLSFAGIRPQIISWFFFSLLLFLLDDKRRRVYRLFVPLLFLLWANLHGGFPAGLVALAVIFFGKALEDRTYLKTFKTVLFERNAVKSRTSRRARLRSLARRINDFTSIPSKELAIIFLASALATLMTPYGLRLWQEIWISTSDNALRGTISEWMPMLLMPHLTFWYYVPFSLFFIVRYRKKFTLSGLLLFAALLIAGLASRRHIPFFLILSLPVTAAALRGLLDEANKKKGAALRLKKAYIAFLLLTLIIIMTQLFLHHRTMAKLTEGAFYPRQAVAFLKAHPSAGNLCSTYNWGGYLIWKLPEKKVCIDGRMPSWKQKAGTNESNNAFEEIQKLDTGDISLEHTTAKYEIDTFLFPQKEEKHDVTFESAIENIIQRMFHIKEKERRYPNLETQFTKGNWIKVYEDPVAAVYRKKKTDILSPLDKG